MLWNENSNKEAHCDQPTTVPTQHIPLIYYLKFFHLCHLICMNTCHYNPNPTSEKKT